MRGFSGARRRNLERSGLREGSDQYAAEVLRIRSMQHELELREEYYKTRLKKRVEANTLRVLGELEATIQRYGEQGGYTLIIKVDKEKETPRGDDLTSAFQEHIFRAQISDVLYRNAAVDITGKVLKDLKNSYRRGRK